MRKLLPCLLFFTFCSAPAIAQGAKKDPLGASLKRWARDLVAGRIDLDRPGQAERKPYLAPELRQKLPRAPQGNRGGRGGRGGRRAVYTREQEARDLVHLALERGAKDDVVLLLESVEKSLSKKGGRVWELRGPITRLRLAILEGLADSKYGARVQDEVVSRLQSGIVEKAGADGGAPTITHSSPEFAAVLIPVLENFGHPGVRALLQKLVTADDGGVQVAAAHALGGSKHGPAIRSVAIALRRAKFPDDVSVLATAISKLVRADKPKPSDSDLKFTIGIVQDRLVAYDDWRSRIALVPITREIRSRTSVSVLIDLLTEGNAAISKRGKKSPFSGTLLKSIHEALVDLSGYYADMRAPDKWASWWAEAKDKFVVAPAKSAQQSGKEGTVASQFFGVPVSGNSVYFVVDTSGSMAWPFEARTAAGPGGRVSKDAEARSRMARAKKELLAAIDRLAPDARFSVAFFSGNVKVWKKKLVEASPANKKAVAAYVKRITANGGTMLYDGLDAALKVKFAKKKDSPYGSSVDEIFLLSDGSPSLGKITNTSEILRVVREWNRRAQVRIHTIYIGNERVDEMYAQGRPTRLPGNMRAAEFMKKLAEENNGRYVRPTDTDG